MSNPWDDAWKKPEARPPSLTVVEPRTHGATPYAAKALASECEALATVGEGARNAELNKSALRMGRHIGAGSIDEKTVIWALTDAARAIGLSQTEIDKTLRPDKADSGLRVGAADPRHPTPRDDTPAPAVTVLTTPEPAGQDEADVVSAFVRTQFPVLDWHQLWTTEAEDDEWILEPVIPARRLVALFSAPKKGKSLIMLEWAVNICLGTTTLGVTPDRPRRVLYVDFENDPRGDIVTRLQAMGFSWEQLDNLKYLSYPTLAKLDTAAGAAELMACVKEYECELVVIDTISRAVQGEENENDTWLSFYRNTGLAMKQAGVACIRLDHTGKDHDKGMRGGSAKYGDVDAVWKLSEITDDTYQLTCTDHRMRIVEKEIVVRRKQNPLRHEVAAEGRMAAWDAETDALVAAMDTADVDPKLGRDKVKAAMKNRGIKASDTTWSRAIKVRKQRLGLHFDTEDTAL